MVILMKRISSLLRNYIPEKFRALAKLFYHRKKLTCATGVIAFICFIICCFLLKSLYTNDEHRTYIGIDLLNPQSELENPFRCYSTYYGTDDESCYLKNVNFFLDFNKRGKDKLRVIINFDLPEDLQNEKTLNPRQLSISASRNLRLEKPISTDNAYPAGVSYESSQKFENYTEYFFNLDDKRNSGNFELDIALEGNIFGTREDEHSVEMDLTNLLDYTSKKYRFPFKISIPVPIGADVSFMPELGTEEPITQGYLRYSSQSLLSAYLENPTLYYGAPYYINVHWSDRIGQTREKFKLYIFGVMTTITLSVLVGVLREFVSFCEEKMFNESD